MTPVRKLYGRRERFDEEKSIYGRTNGGNSAGAGCRRNGGCNLPQNGINKQTFYRWKQPFGGMQPSDVKKLKHLEEENARLKRMVANLSLENDAMKEVLTKKW